MANLLSTNVSGRLYTSGYVDTNVNVAAFRFYDGTTFRGGLGLDDWAHSGSAADITMYVAGAGTFYITTNSIKRHWFNAGEVAFRTYAPDLNYKTSFIGGDQLNTYYGSGSATLYVQYHNGSGGNFNVGAGKLTVDTAGTVIASGSLRAPIFYDSNDTTYYLDPNSSTSGYFAGTLRQNVGKYVRDSYYRTISGYGDYYSGGNAGWTRVAEIRLTGNCSGAVLYGTLYDHRYDGADAYQISIVARAECDFTSNNESHYINVGCTITGSTAYSNYRDKIRVLLIESSSNSRKYEVQFYETNWNHNTWQLESNGWTILSSAEAPSASVGGERVNYISNQNADNVRANSAVYSPIYYDSNNTSYYLDPTSITSIRTVGSWRADASAWDGEFSGKMQYHSNHWYIQAADLFIYRNAGGSNVFTINQSGDAQANSSMRAPIFYDSGDTGYYLDPNDTSNLNQLNTATRARWNMPRYWTNRTAYTSDQGYWTGTNGWAKDHGTWANAWQGGFSGWDIWGEGTDHPQGAGYVHAQGIVSGQHYATSSVGYGWMMVGAANATANRYWLRGKWDTTTSGWVEMITTGNIASQSVSYADESGYSASSGSVEWTSVQNKPATFAPSAHNHDDRYYTESESDGRYAYKSGSAGVDFYANAYYQYEWTRIMGSGSKGIYWQEGSGAYWHIYPQDQADMRFRTGSGNGGIVGTVANETARGYIHWTTSNEIGFLSEDRNWVLRTWNRGVEAYGSMRAPIFYDSSDTTYYLDPNAGTSLKIAGGIVSTAANGAVLLKHENSEANAWIFRENAANWGLFWLNAGGESGQTIGSYTTIGAELFGMNNAVTGYNPNSSWSGTDGNTRAAWMLSNYSGYLWTQGTQYSQTDMRAPIFYDSENTAYYLDPNSTSYLYGLQLSGSNYFRPSNWIQLDSNYGLYWPNHNGAHIYAHTGSYGSIRVDGDRNGWRGISFGASVTLMMNDNESGHYKDGYGWQFRWYNGEMYISPNTYGGGTERTVIHSGNIGSQSVSYASSAGGVSWGNVTSKPSRWLGEANLIYDNAPDTAVESGFWQSYLGSGNPTGTWFNYINVRHSNTGNVHGYQLGMSYYDNNLWFRSYQGNGTYQSWSRALGTNTDPYPSNMNQYVRTTDDVTHNSTTSPTFLVNSHSDNTKGYRIHNTSGSSVSAMFTNSSNQLVIAAGAVDQINLNKKVYVNGVALGVNVSPSATAGRIDASNDIVAYSSSDERLKHNITPIENALDKVKSLTGVEFDWKPEYKHAHGYEGHDTGIIAQQVQEVIPSAVRTNDTGFLAVRYEKLIGLLIEGMKEQQAQIDELKAKLDGLTK